LCDEQRLGVDLESAYNRPCVSFFEPLTMGIHMFRRHGLSAFACALAFILGLSFSYHPVNAVAIGPTNVPADGPAGKGKCLGLTIGEVSGVNGVKLYRTFEDGTVEWNMTDRNDVPWMKIGK
jgi:hypothetical protein